MLLAMSAYSHSTMCIAGVDGGLVKKEQTRQALKIWAGSPACFPPVFWLSCLFRESLGFMLLCPSLPLAA